MKEKTFVALKIASAAIASILMAESFHLEFAISAGIVAILSVAPTKKETLKTASNRFYAFAVALMVAYILLPFFHFQLQGFFLYLICFLLLCQWKNWASAMAMNSVLISHFLTFEVMNFQTITNEILLFLIGSGFGILVNLHLHENTHFMQKMEHEVDMQIKTILSRMAKRISEESMDDYSGECFTKVKCSVRKASEIAENNFMNQLKEKNSWEMDYIAMREQQILILYNIYKRIRTLKTTPITAKLISDFLQFLSDGYQKEEPVQEALERFESLRKTLEESPLPQTRLEFEERAELYVTLGNIEEFLFLKQAFLDRKSLQTP